MEISKGTAGFNVHIRGNILFHPKGDSQIGTRRAGLAVGTAII